MNILAIDTTGRHLTVAVRFGGKWLAEFNRDCRLNHSVVLNGQIDEMMKKAGMTFDDVDVYACNVGVGSFPGIRVGIASIKGFCLARPKKLVAVNTFEILAYNEGNDVSVLVPDNRGVYFQRFKDGAAVGEAAHFVTPPPHGKEIVYDDETDYSDKFISLIDEKVARGLYADALVPLYIRKSQAEENKCR